MRIRRVERGFLTGRCRRNPLLDGDDVILLVLQRRGRPLVGFLVDEKVHGLRYFVFNRDRPAVAGEDRLPLFVGELDHVPIVTEGGQYGYENHLDLGFQIGDFRFQNADFRMQIANCKVEIANWGEVCDLKSHISNLTSPILYSVTNQRRRRSGREAVERLIVKAM